jgi:hypothetical protein
MAAGSIYAADGSWNVTVVDGNTRVGRYAANHSLNVVQSTVTSTVRGLNHKSGAMNVFLATTASNPVARYARDGSLNVIVTPYTAAKQAQKVTVVGGAFV